MKAKKNSKWKNFRDVETQRERRQNDPEYRARYNKMRNDYYHRKKSDPVFMEKVRETARISQRRRRQRSKQI